MDRRADFGGRAGLGRLGLSQLASKAAQLAGRLVSRARSRGVAACILELIF